MARLLENISKQLLSKEGVPVPKFFVATTPEEAKKAAQDIGGEVVIKALVPIGKRKKAGIIKFAMNPEETAEFAFELLGKSVQFFPINKVLVEEKINIKEELYVSITIDKNIQLPIIIASIVGGIDIEEMSKKYPDKISKTYVDPVIGLPDYKSREIWSGLGITGKLLRQYSNVLGILYKVFLKYDCTILEVNPLVLTKERGIQAAAVVMSVDDLAVYRQKAISEHIELGSERSWKPLTNIEKQVVAVNEADPYRGTARYTEMDGGEVGFMCGGGGASLLLFDTLVKLGAQPANYTEFGGNPPERKVYGLAKAIISKPGVKCLFVCGNITNNTQVDEVARGIVRAVKDSGKDPKKYPILVRYAGVKDEIGKQIIEEEGIEYHGDDITMVEAARLMVGKLRAYS